MDAEDRGPALVRGDGGAKRRWERAGARFGVEETSKRALAGEPDQYRAPKRDENVEPTDELEVLSRRLAEADPGIEADSLLRIPAATANASRPPGTQSLRRPRRRNAGRPASGARLALHVHQTEIRTALGHDAGQLGVPPQRRDVVDELGAQFERAGGLPRSSPCRSRRERRRAAREPERLAGASSSAETLAEPGLVDSPPTSTIAAPSSTMRRAAAAAASGSKCRPPSEKLSGVTLHDPHHGRALQTFLNRWTSRPRDRR